MSGGQESREGISVLVVDDQPHFRAVMCEVVAAAGFTLAGEAGSGEEAIEIMGRLAVQIVILDKRMPGIGGIATVRAIADRHPDVLVLLCSVEDPDPTLVHECHAVRVVRKQDLNPRLLIRSWEEHRGEGVD